MKVNNKVNINYTKKDGEQTNRTIIPISVPAKVITALDVTSFDEQQAEAIHEKYTQYLAYRERHLSSMYNFNDWLDHIGSGIDTDELKYRSFDPSKVEVE